MARCAGRQDQRVDFEEGDIGLAGGACDGDGFHRWGIH